MCRIEHQPNIVVECHNPITDSTCRKPAQARSSHQIPWGCVFSRAPALFHGMTQFYQELLTVRRDNNEVFLLPAPRT